MGRPRHTSKLSILCFRFSTSFMLSTLSKPGLLSILCFRFSWLGSAMRRLSLPGLSILCFRFDILGRAAAGGRLWDFQFYVLDSWPWPCGSRPLRGHPIFQFYVLDSTLPQAVGYGRPGLPGFQFYVLDSYTGWLGAGSTGPLSILCFRFP